jgi:hypothetical protein
MQMLDGFNEGWIDFAGDTVKGRIELESVLRGLVFGVSASPNS